MIELAHNRWRFGDGPNAFVRFKQRPLPVQVDL